MKQELTPWFSSRAKPVHKGVYMTDYGCVGYTYWDGKRWGIQSGTIIAANHDRSHSGASQRKRWRGLAVKP